MIIERPSTGRADATQGVSPEARLMLLLARARVEPQHVTLARDIIRGGIHAERLLALLRRNRVSNLFQRSLKQLGENPLTPTDGASLTLCAAEARLEGMGLLATQRTLERNVLLPRGIPYVVLKGSAISQRWYGDPLIRQVSDLDLLIEPSAYHDVVSAMLKDGWKMGSPYWRGHELRGFLHYLHCVELDAEDGRRVEVHRAVDGSGLLFNTRDLLRRATRLRIGGADTPVLSADDEILTAIYHHSKHGWSCYHWIADLLAFRESLEESRLRLGRLLPMLRPTIDASLDLANDIEAIAQSDLVGPQARSGFTQRSLRSIQFTSHVRREEGEQNPSDMEPDFPEDWQRTLGYRIRFQLARLKPSLSDQDWLPLPSEVIWIHWLTRPFRSLWRRWKR